LGTLFYLGNPGQVNAIRDDLEQDSGMKVNTGSRMTRNSFKRIRNCVRLRRNDFHGQQWQPPLEGEDQLASEEIVRAQDQRSSSIEV